MNHITNQHDRISLRVHSGTQTGGNQQLCHWDSDPLDKREIIAGTGNLASYSMLVKS